MKTKLVLLYFIFFGSQAFAEVAFEDVFQKIENEKIWNEVAWIKLNHYKKNVGYLNSEIDDPDFFAAADGKTNPHQELIEFIKILPDPKGLGFLNQPAQCFFRSRYEWVLKRLPELKARLPVFPCPKFEFWEKGLSARSLSLVFASYYSGNPSSFFGHSLLRIKTERASRDGVPLLDYVVNYAAKVTTNNALLYGLYGLAGGFKGEFALIPYSFKLREYSEAENRDLWEYNLNLSPEEIHTLLTHLWELSSTYFNYYFLSENCSYHLLSLIEVAKNNIDLTGHFNGVVIPSETFRVLMQNPGLVSSVELIPSRFRQREELFHELTAQEKTIYLETIKSKNSEKLKVLPAQSQRKVLDLAFKTLDSEKLTADKSSFMFLNKLRVIRSQLPDNASKVAVGAAELVEGPQKTWPKNQAPPHEGHPPLRYDFQIGKRANSTFLSFVFQPAFHDLLSDSHALPTNFEIHLLRSEFRFSQPEQKASFFDFKFIELTNLQPIHPFEFKTSWVVEIRRKTFLLEDDPNSAELFLKLGMGTTFSVAEKSHFYILGYGRAVPFHESGVSAPLWLGTEGGLVVRDWKPFHASLLFDLQWPSLRDIAYRSSYRLETRYLLKDYAEILAKVSQERGGYESLIGYGYYF